MSAAEARAQLAASVAGYFDSPVFEAVAMRKPPNVPNGNYEPDLSRLSFDFNGTLETAPSLSAMLNSREPKPGDRSIRAVTKICLTALTTGWPWVPKTGDRIRVGDALYQVAFDPDRDGSTDRFAFWLNRI